MSLEEEIDLMETKAKELATEKHKKKCSKALRITHGKKGNFYTFECDRGCLVNITDMEAAV